MRESPTPLSTHLQENHYQVLDKDGHLFADCGISTTGYDNATLIYRSVNERADLLAALKALHERSTCCTIDEADCPFAEVIRNAERAS